MGLLGKDAVCGRLSVNRNGFLDVGLDTFAQVHLIREVESVFLDYLFNHMNERFSFTGAKKSD